MNDDAAWFYTREGERTGPVTFGELQGMARQGALNPRVDMVWGVGMESWRSAGEVDGLFEKRQAAQGAAGSLTDPYVAPQPERGGDWSVREGGWPGARRRGFLAAILIFPVVWKFGSALAAGVLAGYLDAELMGVITIAAAFVPVLVGVYFGVMRLVNLGMSGWWYLGNFVPILNMWVGYRCFACPAGYAYHGKLDGAGVVLAVIYWLLIGIFVVVLLALVALFFGAIDSPALREQLGDGLRILREQAVRR